jgi:hypothetical protein
MVSGFSGFFRTTEKDKDGNDVTISSQQHLLALFQSISEGAKSEIDTITQIGRTLSSVGLDIFDSMLSVGLGALGQITGMLMSGDTEMMDEMFNQFNTFLEEFPQMAPAFVEGLVANIDKFIEGFVDAVPALVATLVEIIPTLLQSLVNGLATALPVIVVEVVSSLPGLIIKIVPIILMGILRMLWNLFAAWVNKILPGTPVKTFHEGGMIPGNHEDILINAQSGEGVLSRQGVATLGGAQYLNALNAGRNPFGNVKIPTYHNGGMIGQSLVQRESIGNSSGSSVVSNTNNDIDVKFEVQISGSPKKEDVDKFTDEAVRQIDEKLSKLAKDRKSKSADTIRDR